MNAQDGKFPEFSGKKFGTQKTRLGMQTTRPWAVNIFNFLNLHG